METTRSISWWVGAAVFFAVFGLLVGCGDDGGSGDGLGSEAVQGDSKLEVGTSVTSPESNTTVTSEVSGTDQNSVAPSTTEPAPADDSVAPQLPTETSDSSNDEPGSEQEPLLVEPAGPTFLIPNLDEAIHSSNGANGEPFLRNGLAPMSIIASTSECEVVSIDTQTSQSTLIWVYTSQYLDCDPSDGLDHDREIPDGYIEDVEWADPSFVLLSMCCEPAVGRFEVIDISDEIGPTWLALNGGSPSINENNVLLYSVPVGLFKTIVSNAFDVRYNQDPEGSFYSLESERMPYTLTLGLDYDPDTSASVYTTSWVGEDKIAFELWLRPPDSSLHPFIGLIDLESESAIFASSPDGWTLPTGDSHSNSNLVVVEQECNWVNEMPDGCSNDEAKIVVLDSDSLAPIREIDVDDRVVDMDLQRGWLLVTFSNGQMGILDLADGSFSAIAEGIINAAWAGH